MKKINVTAVSYLNTKPFLFGLISKNWDSNLNIKLDIPSACAKKLNDGKADIGLIPVAALLDNPDLKVISSYCIGSDGPVRTVAIFADQEIHTLKRIYLDFHSRTSVQLARILLEQYWKVDVELLPAEKGFMDEIGGDTGALVIGDRTIELEHKHPYIYDLSEAWKTWKGQPFVFAVWVSRIDLDAHFVTKFNEALALGVREIDRLIYLMPPMSEGFDIREYFTKHISYELDEAKRKALKEFLSLISDGSYNLKFLQ